MGSSGTDILRRMSRGRAVAILGFATALLLGYFAWEWVLSPEARIKATLRAVAEAAENLDADRFLSYVADDYSDFADPDRASLASRLRESFSRVDRLNVTVRSVEAYIDAEPGAATARFDLVVVAIRGEERYLVLGTPFEGEKIEAKLVRDEGTWKIRQVVRASRPAKR